MPYKNLPRACEKQELYKLFTDLPEKELRSVMNKIIAKNRELPMHQAKFKKILRKNEVKLVMEWFGYIEPEVSV